MIRWQTCFRGQISPDKLKNSQHENAQDLLGAPCCLVKIDIRMQVEESQNVTLGDMKCFWTQYQGLDCSHLFFVGRDLNIRDLKVL